MSGRPRNNVPPPAWLKTIVLKRYSINKMIIGYFNLFIM